MDEKKVGSKKAKVENVDGAARTKQCAVVEPIYTLIFWVAAIKVEELRKWRLKEVDHSPQASSFAGLRRDKKSRP